MTQATEGLPLAMAEGGGGPLEVSIVIPVLNEGEHIVPTLQALRQQVRAPYEVIIVYDADEDTTLPVVRRLMGDGQWISLVKNTIARGPSGALRSGFAAARATKVLVVMGDGCDDLTHVRAMLDLVPGQADLVCPSRYCAGGAQVLNGTSRIKVWIPRAAGFLLRRFAGIRTSDPTNSFKLYSARLLRDLRLRSTVSFSVTLEIVAKAHCLGYRIAEVPTVWRDRKDGKSHFQIGRSLVAYLPWFGLALLRGRVIRLPRGWLRAWCGSPATSSVGDIQVMQHA